MKRFLSGFFYTAWLLCLSATACCATAAQPQGKHFVVAIHEWPPFSSRDAKYFGVIPRLVSDIFQAQGIEVKYRFMPWSDALDGIITEEFDGAIVWMTEDIHHESFLVSDPIVELRSALYYRKDFPAPKTMDDLIGFSMGINSHYIYDQSSYHLLKEKFIEPIKGSDDISQFHYLLDGKIDFYLTPVISSAPLLRYQFTKDEQNALTFTSNLFKFPPVCLIVNRHREGSAAVMEQFNSGLRRLKADGALEHYLEDIHFSRY